MGTGWSELMIIPAALEGNTIIEGDKCIGRRDDFIGILAGDTKGISGGVYVISSWGE